MLKAIPQKYSRFVQDALILVLVGSMLTAGLALISASQAVDKSKATQRFLCGLIVGATTTSAQTNQERLRSSKLFRDYDSSAVIRHYFHDRVLVLQERITDANTKRLVASINAQCGTHFHR